MSVPDGSSRLAHCYCHAEGRRFEPVHPLLAKPLLMRGFRRLRGKRGERRGNEMARSQMSRFLLAGGVLPRPERLILVQSTRGLPIARERGGVKAAEVFRGPGRSRARSDIERSSPDTSSVTRVPSPSTSHPISCRGGPIPRVQLARRSSGLPGSD